MKTKILTVALFLFYGFSGFATHFYSGYISYELINPSKNEYKITVTTYTDSRSPAAHRDEVALTIGYGSREQTLILKTDENQSQITIEKYYWKNVYSANHQFPTESKSFTLTLVDPNLANGFLNINESTSVNVPAKISTILNTNGNVNSPVFDSVLIRYANLGQFYSFTGGLKDADNDHVTIELMDEADAYVYPSKISSGTQVFAARDANLIWNKPTRKGLYLAKIRVVEYDKTNTSTINSETEAYISILCTSSNPNSIDDLAESSFIEQRGNKILYMGKGNNNQLNIYNLCGQLVVSKSNVSALSKVDLPNQKGIYIVQFKEGLYEKTLKAIVQ